MEAIGALASLIGVVGAGTKLSIALFDFASTIGSASAEVQAVAIEISQFCAVMGQLERTLQKARDKRYSISAINVTTQILDRCGTIFQDIDIVLQGLWVKKQQHQHQHVDLKAKIKWAFKRAKIQTHRATLESCKLNLQLMLTTLEIARKVSSRRVSCNDADIGDQQAEMIVQSLQLARQASINRLAEIEDHDGMYEDQASSQNQLQDSELMSAEPRIDYSEPHASNDPLNNHRASVWLNSLHDYQDENIMSYGLPSIETYSEPEVAQNDRCQEDSPEETIRRTLGYSSRPPQVYTSLLVGLHRQILGPDSLHKETQGPVVFSTLPTAQSGAATASSSASQESARISLDVLTSLQSHESSQLEPIDEIALSHAQSDQVQSSSRSQPPSPRDFPGVVYEGTSGLLWKPPLSLLGSTIKSSAYNMSDYAVADSFSPVDRLQYYWDFETEDQYCFPIMITMLEMAGRNGADWRLYNLYIISQTRRRLVKYLEKPLVIYKELEENGKNPECFWVTSPHDIDPLGSQGAYFTSRFPGEN